MDDRFLRFTPRAEREDTWVEALPLTDAAGITRFVLFLQQALDADTVDLELQVAGHYRFHVAVAPSRVFEALLRFSGSFPAEVRLSAAGRLLVRFGPAGPPVFDEASFTRVAAQRAAVEAGEEHQGAATAGSPTLAAEPAPNEASDGSTGAVSEDMPATEPRPAASPAALAAAAPGQAEATPEQLPAPDAEQEQPADAEATAGGVDAGPAPNVAAEPPEPRAARSVDVAEALQTQIAAPGTDAPQPKPALAAAEPAKPTTAASQPGSTPDIALEAAGMVQGAVAPDVSEFVSEPNHGAALSAQALEETESAPGDGSLADGPATLRAPGHRGRNGHENAVSGKPGETSAAPRSEAADRIDPEDRIAPPSGAPDNVAALVEAQAGAAAVTEPESAAGQVHAPVATAAADSVQQAAGEPAEAADDQPRSVVGDAAPTSQAETAGTDVLAIAEEESAHELAESVHGASPGTGQDEIASSPVLVPDVYFTRETATEAAGVADIIEAAEQEEADEAGEAAGLAEPDALTTAPAEDAMSGATAAAEPDVDEAAPETELPADMQDAATAAAPLPAASVDVEAANADSSAPTPVTTTEIIAAPDGAAAPDDAMTHIDASQPEAALETDAHIPAGSEASVPPPDSSIASLAAPELPEPATVTDVSGVSAELPAQPSEVSDAAALAYTAAADAVPVTAAGTDDLVELAEEGAAAQAEAGASAQAPTGGSALRGYSAAIQGERLHVPPGEATVPPVEAALSPTPAPVDVQAVAAVEAAAHVADPVVTAATSSAPPALPTAGGAGGAGTVRDTAMPFSAGTRRPSGVRPVPVDIETLDDESGPLAWDAFATVAAVNIRQARRRGNPLALVIVALDEAAGARRADGYDAAALDSIAGMIMQRVGESGSVGRHGPRSFAILLHDADREAAWVLAQDLRGEVTHANQAMTVSQPFTVSLGVSTALQAGSTLSELVKAAEDAVIEVIEHGGDAAQMNHASGFAAGPAGGPLEASRLDPAPSLDRDQLLQRRRQVLEQARDAFERDESDGIAIQTSVVPCPACRDAAQRIYVPRWAPMLPISGCTAFDGCHCLYSLPRVDPRRRPPPAPATRLDRIEIPKALRSAALFAPEPRGTASPEDLAQYLDSYPLLPFEADLDLEPAEVVYLTRPVRFGWEEMPRSGEIGRGFTYPERQEFLPWVRLLGKPPAYPGDALPKKSDGVVHLTNWRIFFGNDRGGAGEAVLDSILLADIVGVECYREGIVLAANGRFNRLVLLVKDPMQVGLCFARALRDIAILTR